MGYYQDVYLKSDDWKSLRKEKILRDGFRCTLCLLRPKRLDKTKFGSGFEVHHLAYKNLYDVVPKDLRTLCSKCHREVHALMRKYPKMKKLPREAQWFAVLYHLRPNERGLLAGMVKGIAKDGKPCSQTKGCNYGKDMEFARYKEELIADEIVCRNRMRWRDDFFKNGKILTAIKSKDKMAVLNAFMEVTGTDPRRASDESVVNGRFEFPNDH